MKVDSLGSIACYSYVLQRHPSLFPKPRLRPQDYADSTWSNMRDTFTHGPQLTNSPKPDPRCRVLKICSVPVEYTPPDPLLLHEGLMASTSRDVNPPRYSLHKLGFKIDSLSERGQLSGTVHVLRLTYGRLTREWNVEEEYAEQIAERAW